MITNQPRIKEVDPGLRELVRVRAAQVNGGGFTLDLHLRDAWRSGLDEVRLGTLATWRGSVFFTEHERAALAVADEAAGPCGGAVLSAPVRAAAVAHFGERGLAQLLATVQVALAWNRFEPRRAELAA